VGHYNDPFTSLKDFSVFDTLERFPNNYVTRFQEMSSASANNRLKRLPRFYQMNRGLHLTHQETESLVEFLKNALTSPKK